MRIFYLSESILPSKDANAVQVMRMARAFARVGAQVTLIARCGGPLSTNKSLFADYGVEPVFRLRRLPYLPLRGMKRAYALAGAVLSILGRADAVYGRCLHSAYAAARLGLPVFYEMHGLPTAGGHADRRWLPALLAHSNCLGVITISRVLQEDVLARYNLLPDRIIVEADGADAPAPHIQAVLPATERLRVGFTGQLYAGKGMEIILPLAQACSWAEFHVVGGREPELGVWRERASGLSNLNFHGYVNPAAVPAFIQSFDVVLLPNQREVLSCGGEDIGRWTSPLKLFEYMAAGKAILASDLPVLREVLEPGVNAVLCDPGVPQDWIGALDRLSGNAKLRANLGIAARKAFEARYSWQSRAQRLLNQIQLWLEERALAPAPAFSNEPTPSL